MLLNLDKYIFIFINNTLQNKFFDIIFIFITEKNNWALPAIITIILLLIYGGTKARELLVLILISILITDQFTSNVIKDMVMRLRPYLSIPEAKKLVFASSYSFPSAHAANAAGVAILSNIYYPKYKYIYWTIVFLIGFSRIYVGVHYPGDVLGGVLIGILVGWALNMVKKRII